MKKSMKPWYLSDALIQKIEQSQVRKEWCDTGAYDHFYDLERTLPAHFRDRSRIGALFISEMLGTEGKNLWLFPVEGHKKILMPRSEVKLLTKSGEMFYEGHWQACGEEKILQHEEFYLWLKPIENRQEVPISLAQKLKGFVRLLKHKSKTRR